STVFSVAFIHDADEQQYLVCGLSTGSIRLISLQDAVSTWLASGTTATPRLAWPAHTAAVTSLHCIGTGDSSQLVSGGDDGVLHVWRVAQLLAAAADPGSQPPAPVASLQLGPAYTTGYHLAGSGAAGITAAALDARSSHLVAGTTDGGVHCIDLAALSSGGHHAGLLHSWGGHLAAVLDVDCSPHTGQAASASEDGSVRLWDVRSPSTTSLLLQPTLGSGL
ncbi:WD_REPEATS_REGION domain-containing protein, partial [Haematococcus lacustris]